MTCPCCQHQQPVALPPNLPPGVFGPGVVALTALLRRYRLSDRDVVDLYQTVVGMPISVGSVVRLCAHACDALALVYDAIQTVVETQETVNVDETRWREANTVAWLWSATTPQATLFRIDASRSRHVFHALLTHADQQIVGSDRYSAYHHLANEQRQLRWVHLIRDVRSCLERSDSTRTWAQQVLTQVRVMFAYWQWYRAMLIDHVQLQVQTAPARATIETLLRDTILEDRHGNTLRADLLAQWDALWTFVRVEGCGAHQQCCRACCPSCRVVAEGEFWHPECGGESLC